METLLCQIGLLLDLQGGFGHLVVRTCVQIIMRTALPMAGAPGTGFQQRIAS